MLASSDSIGASPRFNRAAAVCAAAEAAAIAPAASPVSAQLAAAGAEAGGALPFGRYRSRILRAVSCRLR